MKSPETFTSPTPENQSETIPNSEMISRNIVAKNSYEEALSELTTEGLLSEQVDRIKHEYDSILELKELDMSEADWQMLTVLELYDTQTAEHSVRVLKNSHSAIKKPLDTGSETPFFLSSYLEAENVSIDEFLHAALFHDIGKTIVPHIILRDKTTAAEFGELFCNHVHECGSDWLNKQGLTVSEDPQESLSELQNQNKRPLDVLPLSSIILAGDLKKLQQDFPNLEINSETTMRDILKLHEAESERIMKEAGMDIPSIIAGQHHNYSGRELIHPNATNILRLSRTQTKERSKLADILQIIDVTDAMRSVRHNKEALSEVKVLEELIADTKAGRIDRNIAYLWIHSEYENIMKTVPEDISPEQNKLFINFIANRPIPTKLKPV